MYFILYDFKVLKLVFLTFPTIEPNLFSYNDSHNCESLPIFKVLILD